MQKKKKSKNLNGKEANEKEGQKEYLKKRMKLLKKERVIYVYIKIGITINLKHLSKEYSQLLVVLIRKNARK